MEKKIKIFVSYSHDNKDWVEGDIEKTLIPWLKKQLKRSNVIFWTDQILANHIGEEYRVNIKKNIDDADIALLLISQEFSTSDFILDYELPWIKEAFDNSRLKIVPLLISKVSDLGKNNISWIFELQTIPNDTKPLIEYRKDDVQWSEIRISILNALASKFNGIFESKKNKKTDILTHVEEDPVSINEKEENIVDKEESDTTKQKDTEINDLRPDIVSDDQQIEANNEITDKEDTELIDQKDVLKGDLELGTISGDQQIKDNKEKEEVSDNGDTEPLLQKEVLEDELELSTIYDNQQIEGTEEVVDVKEPTSVVQRKEALMIDLKSSVAYNDDKTEEKAVDEEKKLDFSKKEGYYPKKNTQDKKQNKDDKDNSLTIGCVIIVALLGVIGWWVYEFIASGFGRGISAIGVSLIVACSLFVHYVAMDVSFKNKKPGIWFLTVVTIGILGFLIYDFIFMNRSIVHTLKFSLGGILVYSVCALLTSFFQSKSKKKSVWWSLFKLAFLIFLIWGYYILFIAV